jgi:hypothetical protein
MNCASKLPSKSIALFSGGKPYLRYEIRNIPGDLFVGNGRTERGQYSLYTDVGSKLRKEDALAKHFSVVVHHVYDAFVQEQRNVARKVSDASTSTMGQRRSAGA